MIKCQIFFFQISEVYNFDNIWDKIGLTMLKSSYNNYIKQGFGGYGFGFKDKNSRKRIFTSIVMKLKIKGYPSARIPFSL